VSLLGVHLRGFARAELIPKTVGSNDQTSSMTPAANV
jgi:hypothetical protein